MRPAGTSSWFFSGYSERFRSGRARSARGELRLPGAVVRPVRGEDERRHRGRHDRDVARASSHAQLAALDRRSGLSGQDSAIWVRPNGTSSWYFSGYPNASGQVAQEVLVASYDVQFRWLGVYPGALGAGREQRDDDRGERGRAHGYRSQDLRQQPRAGANTSVITAGGTYYLGYTNGSGQYVAQVARRHGGVQCTKSPLTGTNSNVVVPSGGTSATVMLT